MNWPSRKTRARVRFTPEKISYTIKRHHRARTLRLRVFRDGTITVVIPRWATFSRAEAFVHSKTDWLLQALSRLPVVPSVVQPEDRRAEYKKHQAAAESQIRRLVESFAADGKFAYRRMTIRNQRTCWGSCSRNGALSFNYRLIFLPRELQEYVVVHELCHLREMNHSPKFWKLVASILPDYPERRRSLRRIDVRGPLTH